jgi:enamine deaminase RidA (YjgF/YER057c/UK114 family)
MDKTRRNYPDIAPAGPTYSRAVRAGNLLFISGCTARGTEAQRKSLMEQLRVTLDRICRIVAAEGGSARDIVKITTFVTSIADWRACSEEQQEIFYQFFKGDYPANSLIEIKTLAEPGLHVEIEATAVL